MERKGKQERELQVIERIEPRPRVSELSYSQQRLWFLDKLIEGRAIYNMPMALLLQGHLDRDALRRAFEEVGRRHEILSVAACFRKRLGSLS